MSAHALFLLAILEPWRSCSTNHGLIWSARGRKTALPDKYYDVGMKTVIEGRWSFDGKRVIADSACAQIDSLLRTLLPVGSTDGGWTQLYRDADGVFWELTYPHSELHGGGPPRLESYALDELRLKYPGMNLDVR
jgi:hypothetical protein